MALQLRRGETRSFSKMVVASFVAMVFAVQGLVALNAQQQVFAAGTPLVAPTLQAPGNNQVVNGASVTNSWGAVTGAVKYEYQSFNSSNTNTTPRFDSTYTTTSKTATNVADGTVFYWRVRAISADGTLGTWSGLWKVTIDSSTPAAPSSLSWTGSNNQGAQNGYTNIQKGTLAWKDMTPSDVDHYVYKFWTDIPGYQNNPNNPWHDSYTYVVKTSDGGYVPTDFADKEGTYYFCVEAVDLAGNTSACTQLAVVYDRTLPTATFTYSNNNGAALTNNDVTVTMTTSEPVQTPVDWTHVDDTHFSRVYGDNGKYQVALTDFAGNTSASQKFEVKRIDRNAPTVGGVNEGDVVVGPVNLSIFDPKYEGYDGFDASHGLTVDGTTVTTASDSSKTYFYTVTSEGYHVVVATDKAGNSTTVSFTIDTTAPTVANVSVDHNPTNLGQLVVNGTVNDANLKDYNLRVYNADKSAQVMPWTGLASTSSVNDGVLGTLNIAALADGNYWVRIWADDLAGNRTGITSQIFIPFTIDRTAPNVNITSFTRNSDGTYTVTGATDDSSDVIVTIDGQAPVTVAPTGGVWSAKTAVLVDGEHTISAKSIDAVGNESTPVEESQTTSSGNTTVEKFAGFIAAALPVRFAATVPFTAGIPNVANNDQSVLGDQTTTPSEGKTSSSSDNKNDDEAVKGASTTRSQGSTPSFVGLAWYWWLAVLAAVVGLWWLLATRRRKSAE